VQAASAGNRRAWIYRTTRRLIVIIIGSAATKNGRMQARALAACFILLNGLCRAIAVRKCTLLRLIIDQGRWSGISIAMREGTGLCLNVIIISAT
jgi:hypothetical protein